MDAINDHIADASKMLLGISDKNFLKWIEYSKDVKIHTIVTCHSVSHSGTYLGKPVHCERCRRELIDWLREQFFDEFVQDMNEAYMTEKAMEAYK